jgi:glycosyltransferase involved in cell wall biosynthesis
MSGIPAMVSIILCTYNRENLLPLAVKSVLEQTYPSWELIVVDDGSTDNSRALISEFRRKEKRIRYHYQSNQGLAAARNTGLRLAKGDLICFVDSDDELAPRHLEHRVRFLKDHPEIDFLHGGMTLIGPKKKQYVVDMTDPTKKIHLNRCHIGGTFFFRRKILKKVGGFSPIPFGEDFDFFRRVEEHFRIRKVRWSTYRYHLDSADRLCDIFTEKLYFTQSHKERL